MTQQLQQLQQVLGTTAVSLGAVTVRIKDNGNVFVKVGTAAAVKFKDVGAAMDFAATEAIKAAQALGAPSEFMAALANSSASTLDEIFRDLDVVTQALTITLGETHMEVRNTIVAADMFRQELIRLGLDAGLATQQMVGNLEAMRNQILGIQESPAERIRNQAAEFNAALDAQIQALAAQLEALLAQNAAVGQVAVDNAVSMAQSTQAIGMGTAQGAQFAAQGAVMAAQGAAGAAEATNVVAQQIAAIQQQLKELTALKISDFDIGKAIKFTMPKIKGLSKGIKGLGKAAGGIKAKIKDAKESLQDFLDTLLGGSSLSALPPMQQIQNMQAQIAAVAQIALHGKGEAKLQALQDLPGLIQALLSTAQGFSPTLFATLSAQMVALMQSILGSGGAGGAGGGGKISAFAEGGIVNNPQIALVGERGPEAIIPLKAGKVPVMMPPDTNTHVHLSNIHKELKIARKERRKDRKLVRRLRHKIITNRGGGSSLSNKGRGGIQESKYGSMRLMFGHPVV
jgi:hypothetical protein